MHRPHRGPRAAPQLRDELLGHLATQGVTPATHPEPPRLAVPVVTVGLARRDTGPRVTTGPSASVGFSSPTGAVLFFDDGYDGITIVDLDRGIAVRHPGGGQRAGDQPHRLVRAGDHLILGWERIYAAPLGVGPSRLLGEATVFLPAAEPDRVWLVDYPGGGVGGGRPQVRSVDTSGRVLLDVPGPAEEQGFPAIGIPGGLVLTTASGLDLWDAATGTVVGHLGQGTASALDVRGDTLAWCESACTTLRLTDLSDVSDPSDLSEAELRGLGSIVATEIAPDGRHVAVALLPVGATEPGGRGTVAVVDTATGAVTPVVDDVDGRPQIAWSPDSRTLFVAVDAAARGARTDLGRYTLASGTFERVTLPFGGLHGFVAAGQDETGPLPEPTAKAADCPPPTIQPSGRTADCTFAFDLDPG